MKHFFLLFLVIAGRLAPAQTTDPARQKLDLIFANLDKSQVPTGRLREYALPLAAIDNFDGLTLRDSGRTDMDTFRHLYVMAQNGRLYGADTLPTIQTFNQRLRAAAPATPGDAIPVAVQYLAYARLRPDAETAGLVSIQNEQLLDVPGRTQSPYQTTVLFAAAPERTYSASSTVSLVLRRNLYLANGARSNAPALYLDFGDGQGYRPATWNQALSTTYSSGGTKRVKVKLVYTYSSLTLNSTTTKGSTTGQPQAAPQPPPTTTETRESWFDLTVFAQPTAQARYTGGFDRTFYPTATPSGSIWGTWAFRSDYTDHLGARVNVRYGQGHTSIVKPFIVVEGYNTAAIAPHLAGENNQNNDIISFLRSINILFASGNEFNNSLQQAGYDLIYIDFLSGTDDIRRNAALFEEVVRWVNTQKPAGSTEQNVVMGESMGGLVARYGLARMVRGGYNPQTRLLVLHDSPQRGANNPMGLQALGRQAKFDLLPFVSTADLSDRVNEAYNILQAPATKQLSIKNVTDETGGYYDNDFIDGPYAAMVNFGSNPPAGFPPIVATSDGSQCGQPQTVPAYQQLSRTDIDYLLGWAFAGRTGIKSTAWARGLPASGSQTIAHLRVWYRLKVLWLTIDVTLRERNYASPANTLPYETLPGGGTNLIDNGDLLGNYGNGFIGLWRFAANTSLYNGNICLVPSYSALDVPTVTPATAYARYINNTTNNTAAPRVARYVAQENSSGRFNETHIRFTARNSEWIFNEMQQTPNPQACSSECSPYADYAISGPRAICVSGGVATYTLTGAPATAVVDWTVTSAAGVIASSSVSGGTRTFVVTAGAATGTYSLTATLSTACGPVTFERGNRPNSQLEVAAQSTVAITSVSVGGPGLQTTVYAAQTGPASDYTWLLNGTVMPEISNRFKFNNPAAPGCTDVVMNVEVRVSNYCQGDGMYASASRQVIIPHQGMGCRLAGVYPNPASSSLTVERPSEASRNALLTVRLFDALSQERAGGTLTTQPLRLTTSTLPTGIYYLHIMDGAKVLSREQIEVTH